MKQKPRAKSIHHSNPILPDGDKNPFWPRFPSGSILKLLNKAETTETSE